MNMVGHRHTINRDIKFGSVFNKQQACINFGHLFVTNVILTAVSWKTEDPSAERRIPDR